MKLSIRLIFLCLVLVSVHVAVYATDCPTCQTTFEAPRQLVVSGTDEVASADFNGDSQPDLVVLKSSTNEVLFLAGDGDGGFAAPVSSSVTLSFSRSLAIADFNTDGKLDLAITNFSTNVQILLGNGAGAFTLHATLTVTAFADRIAIGDFDDDGKQDLAVLSRGGCNPETMSCGTLTVTILLGEGEGNFALAGSFTAGAAQDSSDIAAADFDGDGKLDLALLGQAQFPGVIPFLVLCFGDGAGNFTGRPAMTLDRIEHFTIGDFNRDGKTDLAGSTTDKIRVYLADGHGGFISVDSPNYGTFAAAFSVADFNTDGKVDLLQTNPVVFNDGTILTGLAPLGNGDGSLQLPAPIGAGVEGKSVATADFNNDGKLDLAVSNGSNVFILLNATDCSQPIACVADGDVSVTEGNVGERTVDVTVQLSAPSSTPVTVDFSTAEFEEPFHVSAQSGIDFKPVSGTLTFDPSVTTRTVTATIVGDTTFELDEPFRLALTGATGANVVRLPRFAKPNVVRIVNDDPNPASNPVPHASISDATVYEGDSGTKQAFFTVTLSTPLSDYVNLIYRTVDFNAQSGTDYQGIPAISAHDLWFAPGDTTRTISITIFGDTIPEGRESFFVELVPDQSVIFDRGTGVGTILDDDSPLNPAAPLVVTEEDSPKAIALDAVLQTLGPFSPLNGNYFTADKRTRISLFARNVNFAPGEDPLSTLKVIIRDVDPNANPNTHLPTLEFVGPLAGTDDITQIIVRLPDDITPVGDKIVSLGLPNNLPSNQAVITLKPVP